MLSTGIPVENQEIFTSPSYVSLGKILLRYMAEPLTASGRFDEVQVITYAFNANAGAMRNGNVGSLPIKTSEFKSNFDKYVNERNKFNLTIHEFLTYLTENYIDDVTNAAYGITSRSEYSVDFKDDELTGSPVHHTDQDETILNSPIESRMKNMGIPDGEFMPPKITFHIESVPRAANGEEDLGDLGYSLLRIHIFDEVSTGYTMYLKLLSAMKDRHLGTIGIDTSTEEGKAKHRALASEVLKAAVDAGLIDRVDKKKGVYKMSSEATPALIKRFVASRVPYIRYGSSGTGIKRASMRSIQDSLLSADHIQQAGLSDSSVAPPGIDGDIVPIRMLPTELEIETMGCPFFNYTQQFFVDMDTGTTVDNIYGITGGSCTIEQGKFDTSIKLIHLGAFGTFRSAVSSIQAAVDYLNAEQKGS